MIFSIILARIIDPVFFGIIATFIAITSILKLLIDAGFYQSIVKKGKIDEEDINSVFSFGLGIFILLSVLLLATSPWLASFFEEENLSWILPIGGGIILISEVYIVIMRSIYMVSLNFRTLSLFEMYTSIIANICALFYLYLTKDGLLSLFLRELLRCCILPILLYIRHPISLKLINPINRLKELASFGFRVFAVDQVESLVIRFTHLYISYKYGASHLGWFTRADQYKNYFTQLPSISINKVLFASFSKKEYLNKKGEYKIVIKILFLITLFISLIAFIYASELFILVLGEKWIASVSLFKILIVGGVFFPMVIINLNAIKLFHPVKKYFKTALIIKLLILPAIVIGAQINTLTGVTLGVSFSVFAGFIISAKAAGKVIAFGLIQQFKFITPYLALACIIWFSKAQLSFFTFPVWTIAFMLSLSLFNPELLSLLRAYLLNTSK